MVDTVKELLATAEPLGLLVDAIHKIADIFQQIMDAIGRLLEALDKIVGRRLSEANNTKGFLSRRLSSTFEGILRGIGFTSLVEGFLKVKEECTQYYKDLQFINRVLGPVMQKALGQEKGHMIASSDKKKNEE